MTEHPAFAFYLLPIFVPWVPVFGLIEFIFIVFIYSMVIYISPVLKLVASEGKFAVRFRAGWVIVVVSGGGWVLIVVVEVEEGQVVVVVMVVECRGRMVQSVSSDQLAQPLLSYSSPYAELVRSAGHL